MFVLSLIGCSVDEVFQVTPGEDPPNRPCLDQFHQGGLGKTGQEQPWTSNSTADSGKVGRMPAGILPGGRGRAAPPRIPCRTKILPSSEGGAIPQCHQFRTI